MKRDIQNREDIYKLVCTFYDNIRVDDLLGPIFNHMIKDEEWPVHLDKLTDFWETNLFGIPKFKGSPTQKHIQTDAAFDHAINQVHFDQWLAIWGKTIHSMFEGDLATRAQMAAHNIAQIQNMVIRRQKPKNKKE
ncbi:group III truncated hemoglobin [Wenyingzhuangia aestuarii]|uniref:group III truncated hemoglobin n=1 Tax=Wenyingzhuangia aestuarii TaxID=1647582 RepID=UPI001439EB8F|nr:group III truncated hemoglobin [Wenyingzhuangia aestuarii]NJB82740.1 hemoglobin [Wenyingzhuangia aestuarii]